MVAEAHFNDVTGLYAISSPNGESGCYVTLDEPALVCDSNNWELHYKAKKKQPLPHRDAA